MEQDELAGLSKEEAERRVRQALEAAERARRQRRFSQGIELLIDALRYEVQEDAVYYRLGNLYFDAGDLTRAEYAYRRAIETNPQHVNAHHNLSVVYKKTGRIDESVRMRKRAMRLEAGGWLGRSLAGKSPPFARPTAQEFQLGAGDAALRGAVRGGAHRDRLAGGTGGPWASPGDAPSRDGVGRNLPGNAQSDTQASVGAKGKESEHEVAGEALREARLALGEEYALGINDAQGEVGVEFDPVRDDPEEFRRFGRRVALGGCLVFLGVAVAFLALLYIVGFWLF